MKKIFTVLVCLLLLGALAVSVGATDDSMTLTPSADQLDRGETFTVVFELTNTEAVKTIGVGLIFDETVFELTGGTCHVEGAMFGTVTVKDKAGTVLMNPAAVVSGKLFTFNLTVKADAPYGMHTITARPGIVLGNNENLVAADVTAAVTVACKHAFGDYELVNETTHQHTCGKCGLVETGDHTWNEGTVTTPPSCEVGGEKTLECTSCGTKKTEPEPATGHIWDNDCDAECNNGCGLTRETAHVYETTYTSDENEHWYACSICKDKKDAAAHIPGPAATVTSPQTCTECNYVITPVLTHEHQMSASWLSDDEYHWHRCQWNGTSCHYVEDKAEHDYDSDCDVDCNTCGYIRIAPHDYRQELEGGVNGHWFVCILCGQDSEAQPHDPGPEATDTEPQRCTQCNFVIEMPLSHIHNFGENWYHSEESHWQHCTDPICTETTGEEPHAWDAGVENGDGTAKYTCVVCGKQTVGTGTPPTAPPTVPSEPTTAPDATTAPPAEDAGEPGGFPWEWIAIAAIALLAIGFILLLIEFFRSRKANSHGRFSK